MTNRIVSKVAAAFRGTVAAGAAAAALTIGLGEAQAAEFKLGVVSFFSGGVSGPVGIPSKRGAEIIIDAINNGTLPGPYKGTGKGLGGKKIVPVFSDEAVKPAERVVEYRKLVQKDGVDAVIGYASSGSCLAVAPVAEELKTLTILYYCGTTRIFEEKKYDYVFRTMATADVENIGAARYIVKHKPDLKVVSGMNQNYAWGQDSWRDFFESLKQLKPGVKSATEQFPKIFQGQYGAEISALSRAGSDVIHSSFWGGDMEAFILQGAPRGLFEDQTVILTTGGTAIYRLKDQIPEGTVIGNRGPGDLFAPDTELNRWFRSEYEKKYGEPPIFPSYYMAQAVLGIKAAADKAGSGDKEAVRKALVGIKFDSPSGQIELRRGNGHQAVTEFALGTFAVENGKPVMKNVVRYPIDCVNPPVGKKSLEWIQAGFPGAKCN